MSEARMRYFSYDDLPPRLKRALVEPGEGTSIVTVSEDDIRKEYYPWWYEKMCEKYGKEKVDKNWSFEDCLWDWITTHDAWIVDE
jgi:hypothetical protein